MTIEEITFDEEDKTLFLIDDLQLKADAIRYSILPKLEIISNELISRISETYSINFYENYSVAKSPHFRLSKNQRKENTKTDYTYSGVSLTGQRKDNKWFGLEKKLDKVPKISPTSLSIDLTEEGISSSFYFNHPKNFTKETYKKFYTFFIENIHYLIGLSQKARLNYEFHFLDTFSVKEDLELKFSSENYDVILFSKPHTFPINYEQINDIIYSNVIMFPLLESCIQISLGNEPNIEREIKLLEKNFLKYCEKYLNNITTSNKSLATVNTMSIKERAENKIKVIAGIRWQVFKRDNWKCTSCGRSAEDNVILHVDHIIPRSKGGRNVLENYQTLCETCNIGKSNKDDTDLRRIKTYEK